MRCILGGVGFPYSPWYVFHVKWLFRKHILTFEIIPIAFFFPLPNLPRTLQREYEQLKEQHGQRGGPAGGPWEPEGSSAHLDEADLLAEAKLLRQHKGRLEARMHILEEHNKQLESQLHRLRQLLHQVT